MAGHGWAWRGKARQGFYGIKQEGIITGHGSARIGRARPGAARLGTARQGKARNLI